jgi:hypothetical protein
MVEGRIEPGGRLRSIDVCFAHSRAQSYAAAETSAMQRQKLQLTQILTLPVQQVRGAGHQGASRTEPAEALQAICS